jgi:hypothetical protein
MKKGGLPAALVFDHRVTDPQGVVGVLFWS